MSATVNPNRTRPRIDPTVFKVLGGRYLVELTKFEEDPNSVIALPDSSRPTYAPTDGKILSAGPGRVFHHGAHGSVTELMWCDEGDRIVFFQENFQAILEGDQRLGYVNDADVVAVLRTALNHTHLEPCGEWVKIKMDRPLALSAGGIALPDGAGAIRRSGVVRDWGPGRVRLTGELKGVRQRIEDVLSVQTVDLLNARVHWKDTATTYPVNETSDWPEWELVRASDLLAIEEPEDIFDGE